MGIRKKTEIQTAGLMFGAQNSIIPAAATRGNGIA
jgi:hypothetical protein